MEFQLFSTRGTAIDFSQQKALESAPMYWIFVVGIASDDSDYDAVVAFTLSNLQSIWTNSAEKGTHNLRDVYYD